MAITSGKGGVGKTFLAANLAASLVKRGERVLVFDANLGLANLDVMLGLQPKHTLQDVFAGKATLEQATLAAPGGFSVLLAGSGLVEYARLTPDLREHLMHTLDTVRPLYDRVLLDTGAGISDVVLYAVSLADDVLVVATPEPTSLTAAYAAIKVLASQQHRPLVYLAMNQTSMSGEGAAIRGQLQKVVDRFVSNGTDTPLRLQLIGDIRNDVSVRQAVQRRMLVLDAYPASEAAQGVSAIAERFAPRVTA
jgi:flagellar biosynthesis protein FlhG